MPDQEILDKLEDLVIYGNIRIGKLAGEGKEKVVFHAVELDGMKELVIKLYQSNPMFLLNEVDFEFLPQSAVVSQVEERYLDILEKLLKACERDYPGLFFWHMESLYSRILVGLCEDFEQYNAPVVDTTTISFQNSELVFVGTKALNRKVDGRLRDINWELNIKEQTLRSVIDFISRKGFGEPLNLSEPSALLGLIFCEGFFGTIPSEKSSKEPSSSLFGDLMEDSPSPVEAEIILSKFLSSTDFKSTVPFTKDNVLRLKKALEELRGMLLEDAFDKAEQLRGMGDDFMMRYNAGRNTLLRGLPRFIRTMEKHLQEK